MKKFILFAGAALMFAAPAFADTNVSFKDNKGNDVGTAVLTQVDEGVKITLELHGLPPGEHAIHVHEKGACSPADSFKDAGGHLNPFGHEHGKLSPHGEHAGDMDNIQVDESGKVSTIVLDNHVTLSDKDKDGKAALLDADGSALVIHMSADDYKSQPAGNAGDRLACGVITK